MFSRRQGIQTAAHPPSTLSTVPWMLVASSLARNNTATATSAGVLIRLDGIRASIGPTWSANSSWRLVAIGPGATALTRTPDGPYSSAPDLVKEWMTALVAE